jgi:F-type H+-transporting ATPase subunit b
MVIDWFTLVAQLVNFLVLIALLKRFLFDPVRRSLAEREAFAAALERDATERATRAEEERQRLVAEQRALAAEHEAWLATRNAENSQLCAELKRATERELDEMRTGEMAARERDREQALRGFSEQLRSAFLSTTAAALAALANRSLTDAQIAHFGESLHAIDPATRREWSRRQVGAPPLTVRSAQPLTPSQKEELQAVLRSALNRDDAAQFTIAPELIDGLEMTLGDTTIGWSVDAYLENLSAQLRG